MTKKIYIILLIILASLQVNTQTDLLGKFKLQDKTECLEYYELIPDSLFETPQQIHIIKIPLAIEDDCVPTFVFEEDTLIRTSTFARRYNAIAAINAGFFDIKEGGAVDYLEYNDTVVTYSRKGRLSPLFNGAIIFEKNGEVNINPRSSDSLYIFTLNQKAVLVTGPLLIDDGQLISLDSVNFVTKRHPRTCLAYSDSSLFLITVDGRSGEAFGMDLYELQDFAYSLGCTDAINLDGGGSTTMWLNLPNIKKIVNAPSDKKGERSVANAILILSLNQK